MIDKLPDQGDAINRAKRALHREEMHRFGGELAWIENPSLIPEGIVTDLDGVDERCLAMGEWMLSSLAKWSGEGHGRLSLAKTFERYQLINGARVVCRDVFREQPHRGYAPGVTAMAEIFAASTKAAVREGVPQEMIGSIGVQASAFGEKISQDGTYVQRAIRDYLKYGLQDEFYVEDIDYTAVEAYVLDPAKIKLDEETGITTVTPIDDLLECFKEAEQSHLSKVSGVCVALQAAAPEGSRSSCPNFFQAIWKAYGAAAERLVYPYLDLQKDDITLEQSPDPQIEQIRR